MNKTAKKISLHRETLRQLTANHLAAVAGGATLFACNTQTCVTCRAFTCASCNGGPSCLPAC
jgi:hypothetical protein